MFLEKGATNKIKALQTYYSNNFSKMLNSKKDGAGTATMGSFEYNDIFTRYYSTSKNNHNNHEISRMFSRLYITIYPWNHFSWRIIFSLYFKRLQGIVEILSQLFFKYFLCINFTIKGFLQFIMVCRICSQTIMKGKASEDNPFSIFRS